MYRHKWTPSVLAWSFPTERLSSKATPYSLPWEIGTGWEKHELCHGASCEMADRGDVCRAGRFRGTTMYSQTLLVTQNTRHRQREQCNKKICFFKKSICHLHSIVKPTASPHVLDSRQTRSQLEISDLRPRYKFHCLETTADQNTVLERILFVYRNLPRNSSRDFSTRCDASLLISSFIRTTAFLSRDLGS